VYEVVATGASTVLRLLGTVRGDGGPYVDDVIVTPVPEPASLGFLFGLAVLVTARRARK